MTTTPLFDSDVPRLLAMAPEALTQMVENCTRESRAAMRKSVGPRLQHGRGNAAPAQVRLLALACMPPTELQMGVLDLLVGHWALCVRIADRREPAWKRGLARVLERGEQIDLLPLLWAVGRDDPKGLVVTPPLAFSLAHSLNNSAAHLRPAWCELQPDLLRSVARAGAGLLAGALSLHWQEKPTALPSSWAGLGAALDRGLLTRDDLLAGMVAGAESTPPSVVGRQSTEFLDRVFAEASLSDEAAALARIAVPGGAASDWAIRRLGRLAALPDFDAAGFATKAADVMPLAPGKGALALLQRLKRLKGAPTEPLQRALEAAARHDVPAVRSAAFELAAARGLTLTAPVAESPPPPPPIPGVDVDALARRLAAVSPALRRLGGLPDAIDAPLPVPCFTGLDFPRLTRPIPPIADFDELLDVSLAQLTRGGDLEGFERMMEAQSRMADTIDAVDADRLGGLIAALKREATGFAEALDFLPALTRLLWAAWLTGKAPEKPPHQVLPALQFLADRATWLAQRLARREARPLLGAPTHAGGFIDPRVLVARLAAAPPPYSVGESAQAFLRLAPEFRDEARAQLGEPVGGTRRALAFLLGDPEPATIPPENGELWPTAARARTPTGEWPFLGALPYSALPFVVRPAEQTFSRRFLGRELSPQAAGSPFAGAPSASQQAAELGIEGAPRQLPATRLDALVPAFDWITFAGPSPAPACAAIWPGHQDPFWGIAMAVIGQDVDAERETSFPEGWLMPLVEIDEPLTPAALGALAIAMAAKARALRALATDVLICAARDGRLCGATLGDAILQARSVLPHPDHAKGRRFVGLARRPGDKHIPLMRWLDHLERLMGSGPEGRLAMAEACASMCGGLPGWSGPEGTRFLELWWEGVNGFGAAPLSPEARGALAAVDGSARAKKAARAIQDAPEGTGRRDAARLVLDARLARVERWLDERAAE